GDRHHRGGDVPRHSRSVAVLGGDLMKPCAHILVVDDEINIRGGLVTMLEQKGYQVRGVATAEEGLEQLEAAPAELVITDLRMPGLGRVEVLQRPTRTRQDSDSG